MVIDPDRLSRLIQLAREEDWQQRGDITASLLREDPVPARFAVAARDHGVFAGDAVIPALLATLCPGAAWTPADGVTDGTRLDPHQCIATITGAARAVLAAERTVLNFLQRMAGVATLTRAYVDAVADTGAAIYDTRKTVPGWRDLDKYAVRCGGGHNHRMGLYDAVLVKDNHLVGFAPGDLADGLAAMVEQARRLDPPPAFIEVEVDSLEQLREVFKVDGVDVVLLDNFTHKQMVKAVAMRGRARSAESVQLEASGGVTLEAVRAVAETGVDRIAVGAITHSAPAVDIAFDRLT